MKTVTNIGGLLLAAMLLTACAEEEPNTTTAAAEEVSYTSTPEPDNEPEEGSYGSNARFDRLQDDCEDGDADACSDLYWDSPLGSEYEAIAMANGGMTGGSGDSSDVDLDGLSELAMELVWSGMSATERSDACLSFDLLGAESSYQSFLTGWGESDMTPPTLSEFTSSFAANC